MKKVISCLVALVLMICAVASVSAEISPSASMGEKYIVIDAVPVGGDSHGQTIPSITDPIRIDTSAGETITITAIPNDGYKFSHWDFGTGEFEIVEGDLTTPTITIRPTGDKNIRAYAHFVKEGEDPTVPSSKPIQQPDDGTGSPKTGDPTAFFAVAGSVLVLATAAVIIMRKRQTA